MKIGQVVFQKVVVLVFSLGVFLVSMEGQDRDPVELVGAKVFGPSHLPVGNVVAVLKSEEGGDPLMYVVNANGIFNGRGVIPVANVIKKTSRTQKNGATAYEVSVTVNRSTFKNIATWGKGELLSDYLSRHESLLSTIYDMDEGELAEVGRTAVYDDGKEAKAREAELASM